MMNKTSIAVIAGAVLISGIGLGFQHTSASHEQQPTATEEQAEQLTVDEMRDIVGKQYGGTVTELELERDDGRYVYDVEVVSEQTEYDVQVDAYSGETIKEEVEFDDDLKRRNHEVNDDDQKDHIDEIKKNGKAVF